MDYIMKIFGHFEADSDNRHSSRQEGEKPIQSKEDIKGDDLRRKYLNEPSAKQIRTDNEILAKHSEHQKKTTLMSYLRDMFKSRKQYRLERDEDGYVKKLYSETNDSCSKSDETTGLMTYMNEFLVAKQLEVLGDEKKAGKFGDKTQKLLAKVISHHGNEWFQEMEDANNESGDTKRHKMIKSVSSESLEVDEEDDSIKKIGNEKDLFDENVEKLLTKIAAQHGNEWFQDLDERGDTNFQKSEKQSEGFLKQLFETKNEDYPAKEEGTNFKGDGLQNPEVKLLSYLTDLLDRRLNNPQEKVKTEKERQDNLMVVAYLRKLFEMKSEKLEDTENFNAVKSEDPATLGEDTDKFNDKDEQVLQAKNEYDAKIRTYLDGLFKSKSESVVSLVSERTNNQFPVKSPFAEESEEIVTIATNFGDEAPRIAENKKEIVSYDGDVEQETCDTYKSFDCDEESLHEVPKTQAEEIAPPIGLINCAVDVAKIFSTRNYPPDKEQAVEELAIEEEAYVEPADEEDVFEEALDQYSDEEYSLTNPTNQKSLAMDMVPSHKQGSILHKIYNSGYKYILPHSIEENSLLHHCRQFLSSPDNIITSTPPNFFIEPYFNATKDDANDTMVNSMSESVKNEDVFEDAQEFLFEKAKEDPNSYITEDVFQTDAGVRTEIRFLVCGDSSEIILLGINEEEATSIQDVFANLKDETFPEDADSQQMQSFTISAPEMFGISKPGRIYDAIQDAKLDMRGSSHSELRTKDDFGEPHEINFDLATPNVLTNALFLLEEQLGKKSIQKSAVKSELKSEIRFFPPETNGENQDVGGRVQNSTKNALVLGKNEPEVEEIATADKIEAHDLGIAFENNEINITQKMLNKN